MLKHVLVPVLSAADLPAIPNLVRYLKSQKPLSVVVVNSPSVGVTAEDSTRNVDKRISDLTQAKADAVAREDYPAAEQFKQQIEEAKLSRQEVVRNVWKSVAVEQRNIAYQKQLDAQFSQLSTSRVIRRTLTEDTEDLSTILSFLESKGWPKDLPKGGFSIILPGSVSEQPVEVASTVEVPAQKAAPPADPVDPKEARRKELGRYFTMKKAAESHKIDITGRKSSEVVEEILAIEFPA